MAILNYEFSQLLSFIQQILSTYCVSETVLGFGGLAVNSTGKMPLYRVVSYNGRHALPPPSSCSAESENVTPVRRVGPISGTAQMPLGSAFCLCCKQRGELNCFLTGCFSQVPGRKARGGNRSDKGKKHPFTGQLLFCQGLVKIVPEKEKRETSAHIHF